MKWATQERTNESIVDVPVPQILEETLEMESQDQILQRVRGRRPAFQALFPLLKHSFQTSLGSGWKGSLWDQCQRMEAAASEGCMLASDRWQETESDGRVSTWER